MAVDPSEAARQQVAELTAELARRFDARGIDGFRFVDTENLHVTLHFLGHVDMETDARVRAALAPPLGAPAFDVTLGGLGTFPSGSGARVLWVAATEGAPALAALHEETGGRLRAAGLMLEARPFAAHLTLARRRVTPGRRRRAIPPDALVLRAPDGCRWRVDHVTLYESRLSSHGAHHEARLVVPLTEALPT